MHLREAEYENDELSATAFLFLGYIKRKDSYQNAAW